MKKFIVTTTINKPTKATIKFSNMPGWTLVVVGDKKTPHYLYKELDCVYLSPDMQEHGWKELSDTIGWNSIQRRNIGFVYAYEQGADVIATVDDDNIPYDNWGEDILVGQKVEFDLYKSSTEVFDPLSVTNYPELWHRGFPIQQVPYRSGTTYDGKDERKVLIQADLWDGDPDIDAMARLSMKPCVKFNVDKPYGSYSISPFNSQNTFLSREVIPYYTVLPHVGRMDDIWGGYIAQLKFPNSVLYNKASVYQDRNVQDLVKNLENEIIGYRHTQDLLQNLNLWKQYVPEETVEFYEAYRRCFK
jgi:hypothetical protein